MLDGLRNALLKRLEKATTRLADLDDPFDYEAQRSLCNAALLAGDYPEAERSCRKILATNPNDVKTLVNLGFALKEQRRFTESRVFLRRAIAQSRDDPLAYETHYLFGLVAEEQGDWEDARKGYAAAFDLKPDFSVAGRDLCRVLFAMGKAAAAQTVLTKGLLVNPDYADFHFFQGNFHVENQNPKLAAQSYLNALRLGAVYAEVYSALGAVQYQLGDQAAAVENFQHAIGIHPSFAAVAQYQAGCYCLRRGDYANAIASFESALVLRPDFLKVHSSLLFCLSFNPSGPPTYREAALRFGELLKEMSQDVIRPKRSPYQRGTRPLKIGFVSGEFRAHPVGFFLEGILKEVDAKRCHLIAYSNASCEDQTTSRLRQQFAQWHEIKGLNDQAAAQLIRDHRVDILVDLGGHTGDNRLPVFALRPAPVQVTWLGYFASTGVAEMDFILADRISVPEPHTEFFSEKIWYLPDTRLCMTAPVTQQEVRVASPPCQSKGFPTFGSFQARTKINDHVLAVWAQVLAGVPNARLRLQMSQMDVAALRDELLGRISAAGIALERVSVTAGLDWEAYLAAYNEVDIVLDSFPYPGGTTTSEALWMGVPTLTLQGDTMLSRQGALMMDCVGLPDWVAHSESEYIAKAIQFANDVPSLALLRAQLRERALRSPLFDTRRFAANLQNCFEDMFESPA